CFCFFFQAEDGIRDATVTGVQTCALPICLVHLPTGVSAEGKDQRSRGQNVAAALERLREKLARRAYRPPPRHKTRPTRASREKRIEEKHKKGQKKKDRRWAE